jgi:hypothetical protein
MKIIKIAVPVLLTLILCSASVSPKTDYKKETETFLVSIIKGEVDKAYGELLSNSMLANKLEEVKLLKEQTKTAVNLYGKLIGYEPVKTQKYGNSIVRLVYVLKCERMPVIWEFYFYKAASDWKLTSIKFNDKYDLLADK